MKNRRRKAKRRKVFSPGSLIISGSEQEEEEEESSFLKPVLGSQKCEGSSRQGKVDAHEKRVNLDQSQAEKRVNLDHSQAEKRINLDQSQAEKRVNMDQSQAEKPVNLAQSQEILKIIDVSADRRIFDSFVEEMKAAEMYSLAVAVERQEGQKEKVKQRRSGQEQCQVDTGVVVGVAFSFTGLTTFYLSLVPTQVGFIRYNTIVFFVFF